MAKNQSVRPPNDLVEKTLFVTGEGSFDQTPAPSRKTAITLAPHTLNQIQKTWGRRVITYFSFEGSDSYAATKPKCEVAISWFPAVCFLFFLPALVCNGAHFLPLPVLGACTDTARFSVLGLLVPCSTVGQ